MDVNLTYDDNNWKKLPYNIKLQHLAPPQMYGAPPKISYKKSIHLQEIKVTILKKCHHFYDNLEHHPNEECKTVALILFYLYFLILSI